MTNVLFLHAHPDDEAIFTGGTIRALADSGHNVSVVFATGGELGQTHDHDNIGSVRRNEARQACDILGVANVEFLEYHDSGLDAASFPAQSLARCDVLEASKKLSTVMKKFDVDILFCDDTNGIYGHPDHKMCHKIAVGAAELQGLKCVMEFTVDGEHLHFVESHVVKTAFDAFGITTDSPLYRGTSLRQHPGLTTVEISNSYRVNGAHLQAKSKAIAQHKSQITPESAPLVFSESDFSQVYGIEWFRHFPLHDGHKPDRTIFDDLR